MVTPKGIQDTIAKLELERRQIKLEKRQVSIELKILTLKQMPPALEVIDLTANPEVIDLTASPVDQPSIKSEHLRREQDDEVVEMGREEDIDPPLSLASGDEVDLQHLTGEQDLEKTAVKQERLPDLAHPSTKGLYMLNLRSDRFTNDRVESHQQLPTPASLLPSSLAEDARSDTLSAHSSIHSLPPVQDQLPSSEPHKNFLQKRRKRSYSPVRDETDLDRSPDGPKRQRRRMSHIFDSVERPAPESSNSSELAQGNAADGAVLVWMARSGGPEKVADTTSGDIQGPAEKLTLTKTHEKSSVEGSQTASKTHHVYKHQRMEICRRYGSKLRSHMLQSKYCPREDRDDLVDIFRQVFESETAWKTLDDVHGALRVGLASVDDWRTRGQLLTQLNNFQMASQWWWVKCMNDEKLISQKGRLEVMKKAVKEVRDGVFTETGYARYVQQRHQNPKGEGAK